MEFSPWPSQSLGLKFVIEHTFGYKMKIKHAIIEEKQKQVVFQFWQDIADTIIKVASSLSDIVLLLLLHVKDTHFCFL